jgi:hypothetical protein
MAGTTFDFQDIVGQSYDKEARVISARYDELMMYRTGWELEKTELRNYLFATDTTKTTNKKLPWKNSTTLPKLTQIRDNLHANYMAALFPTTDWLTWEGDRLNDEINGKRAAIEAYMRTKLRQDRAEVQVSKLLLDYVDAGNCFATAEWVDESYKGPDGAIVRGYVGPRIVRISPHDIVFDPTASDFQKSPKIIRSIKTLGELVKYGQNLPPDSTQGKLLATALEKGRDVRQKIGALGRSDVLKAEGYAVDGFANIQVYYQSGFVELLTFFGDFYNIDTGELLENHIITIIDRLYVVDIRPSPNWTSNPGIFHAGWRQRPDNLYAMGPLDNLVGMQYRIDHLENLKADVFDMIAFPSFKIKGNVEDFEYGPLSRIYTGDEGDVTFMSPPTEALNADNQIEVLERRMEEMAGAPREAMGIRSPGEKTKFEVQLLDNAASRIFMNKITHFERVFFEPLLNFMLVLARRNMSAQDVVRTLDSEVDAVVFSTISKEDIVANGILRPQGASHFAEKANALQNLVTTLNSQVAVDPSVAVHLSGKRIAQALSQLSGIDQYKIYGENIRVIEEAETKKLMQAAGEQAEVASATPPGITEGDPASRVK